MIKKFSENIHVELDPSNNKRLYNKYYKKILFFFGFTKTNRLFYYEKNNNTLSVNCKNLRYEKKIPNKYYEHEHIFGVGKIINGSLSFFGGNNLIENINVNIYTETNTSMYKTFKKYLYIYADKLSMYYSTVSSIDLNITLSKKEFSLIKQEILKYNQKNTFKIEFNPCDLKGIYCSHDPKRIHLGKTKNFPNNDFKILEKYKLDYFKDIPKHIKNDLYDEEEIRLKFKLENTINNFSWKLHCLTNENIFTDWSENDFVKLNNIDTKLKYIKKFLVIIIFLIFIIILLN